MAAAADFARSKDWHARSIVALCTGNSRAALALIRVSGDDAVCIIENCIKLFSKKTLDEQVSHSVHFAQVYDGDLIIDQVMVFLMRSPRTFTGQDTVEISCHGNPLLVEQIIGLIIKFGARLAGPGEFSQRAVLNDKIDLIQAEAICELISANTQLGLAQSMRKLKAGLSHEIGRLEELLLKLIATLEASFEFLEEEERDVGFGDIIKQVLQQLLDVALPLKLSCQNQSQIAQGIKIALLGVPNAGKSTLFNQLTGANKAIVHAQAGTTRDSIESLVMQEGQLWSIVDTAGIRQTCDEVELEGIKRSMIAAKEADVILLLLDPTQAVDAQQELLELLLLDFAAKIIPLVTKADLSSFYINFKTILPESLNNDLLVISAKTGAGIEVLRKAVETKIKSLFEAEQSLFALNQRQKMLLQDFFGRLEIWQQQFLANVATEILIFELTEMLQNLSNLTGKDLQEEILNNVFKHFCVGK